MKKLFILILMLSLACTSLAYEKRSDGPSSRSHNEGGGIITIYKVAE